MHMTPEEILDELISMCSADKRTGKWKRPFSGANRPRVRHLGFLLNEIEGDDLMVKIYEQIPEEHQRELEYVWNHIGYWEVNG